MDRSSDCTLPRSPTSCRADMLLGGDGHDVDTNVDEDEEKGDHNVEERFCRAAKSVY